jgi:hypothetical protein
MELARSLWPPGANRRRAAGSRGGFTLVDTITALLIVGVVIGVVAVLVPARARTGCGRPLKDSTQVRGVLQGMVIWAQNNNDDYPLPSAVDVENATVTAEGVAKDTTSNIFSLLIYNGFVPTEMFRSPAEANGSIEEYRDYEFDSPSKAASPSAALWDPAFHASPDPEFNIGTELNPADVGNNSYAHALPVGTRRPLWGSTFVATEVAIANRGPRIERVTKGAPPKVTPVFDTDSNTLLIHGSRTKWEGNVGYQDNHVSFETGLTPGEGGPTYLDESGVEWLDVLFYDEPDDPTHTNACLGIWNRVGEKGEGCVGWWD